jgi:hypothetical protein
LTTSPAKVVLWRTDNGDTVKPVRTTAPAPGTYPGKDDDGKSIYTNTHFLTEEEAWEALEADVRAQMSLLSSEIVQAESLRQKLLEHAAQAVKRQHAFNQAREAARG